MNTNLMWAFTFVDALAAAGLTAVCVSPGSRNTPLTLAFEAHPAIALTLHHDERSAGFFALGQALATDQPVALLCTSGSAGGNYLPAVIEAKMSHVPLLLLTADRPHELRHSGANQTIDQIGLFGEQVLWSVDMPLPQEDAPAVAMRNWSQTAVRAVETANGLPKGPVHLNFPFRKPFEPSKVALGGQDLLEAIRAMPTPSVMRMGRGVMVPSAGEIEALTAVFEQHPRGLIVCGPRCPAGDFSKAVLQLSQKLGYPVVADPLSGVRWGTWAPGGLGDWESLVVGGGEGFFQQAVGWDAPTLLLRFGAVPVSKWVNSYLDNIEPAVRMHVRSNGVYADDGHRTTHFLQLDETQFCRRIAERVSREADMAWVDAVMGTEKAYWRQVEAEMLGDFFDGTAVYDLVSQLPDNATLFMGNSLPIRHLDQFGQPSRKRIQTFGNRGASGIDGNLSTGLGISLYHAERTVIVTGDITFYHDMNGLLAIGQQGLKNVTIVLLNNDGGGIFNRLPVAQHDPPFGKLFRTPHGLAFVHAARLYGLAYQMVNVRRDFEEALKTSFATPEPMLIEVLTDGEQDDLRRRDFRFRS